jgi:hypothetical protein
MEVGFYNAKHRKKRKEKEGIPRLISCGVFYIAGSLVLADL